MDLAWTSRDLAWTSRGPRATSQELAQDPSNILMVLSGQSKVRMEEVFAGMLPSTLPSYHPVRL